MKVKQWLAISKKGIKAIRKTKPNLGWNEIAVQIQLEIPDELFMRPTINARLEIKDIPVNEFNPDVVVNTKELIEQQTGVKINFTVVQEKDDQTNS